MDQEAIRQSINRGNALAGTGHFHDAQGELRVAAEQAELSGLLDEQLQALISLSFCSFHLGERDCCLAVLERAKNLARTCGDLKALAKCHLNLGGILMDSDHGRALEEFESSLKLFQTTEDVVGVAQALDNIGTLLGQVGRPKDAIPYMTRAAKLFASAGAVRELGICYQAIGIIWSDGLGLWEDQEDAYQRARKLYEQASECYQQCRDARSMCNIVRLIGLLDADHEDYDTALANLNSAIKLSSELGLLPLQSSALLGLGATYCKMGKPEASLQPFEAAAAIKVSIGDHRGVGHALTNEGIALNSLGRFIEAEGCFLDARAIFAKISQSHESAEGVSLFNTQIYVFWTEFLYAMAKQLAANPAGADLMVLLTELEISKAASQASEHVDRGVWTVQDEEELREDLLILTQRANAAGQRRALRGAMLSGTVPTEAYELWLRDTLDKNEAGTVHRRRFPRASNGNEVWKTRLPPIAFKDTTSWLCMIDFEQKDEICLVLHTAKEDYLSVVSASSMRVKAIDSLLKSFNEQHSGEFERQEECVLEVGRLLGKLLEDAGVTERLPERGTSLLLLPHGSWHKFPWECARITDGYLGLNYAIVRGSSFTQSFADQPRQTTGQRPRKAILCAPDFSTLNYSQVEVRLLEVLLRDGGFDTSLCVEPDATKEEFISRINGEPVDLLHFAGHCTFNLYDANLSGFELCAVGDNAHRDSITALELSRRCSLRNSPHVFINGCSSGLMDLADGDRFTGILAAIKECGAGSTVLTAWDVSDASAADFSGRYYEALLGGATVSQAILSARTAVDGWAAAGKYGGRTKLIHWGPFVAYGPDISYV
jgi:tetratricopeptide (TPR) repeat protein/CHAT domain-containing protein